MPRKAIRIELNKEHATAVTVALHYYISEHEGSGHITIEELKSIKKLHGRFAQHLKSFEDNL